MTTLYTFADSHGFRAHDRQPQIQKVFQHFSASNFNVSVNLDGFAPLEVTQVSLTNPTIMSEGNND